MKIFKQIVNSLSVVIMVACVGAFALFGLAATGWKALAVPTGSMRPIMPPGSLVFVHRVPISTLRVGDVITYNSAKPGVTISHRIIRSYLIDNKIPAFVTKGDANKIPDQPIAAGSIVGKVEAHVPHLGSWVRGSKSWLGITLVIYFPALLMMVEEMQRMAEYLRKFQPYTLFGYEKVVETSRGVWRKFAASALVSFVLIAGSVAIAFPVHALLQSNTVTLSNNRLSVAPAHHNCSSNNDIDINNSSNQTASSGNASSTGNTTGGTATSGSASNSNNTTITITTTGC